MHRRPGRSASGEEVMRGNMGKKEKRVRRCEACGGKKKRGGDARQCGGNADFPSISFQNISCITAGDRMAVTFLHRIESSRDACSGVSQLHCNATANRQNSRGLQLQVQLLSTSVQQNPSKHFSIIALSPLHR